MRILNASAGLAIAATIVMAGRVVPLGRTSPTTAASRRRPRSGSVVVAKNGNDNPPGDRGGRGGEGKGHAANGTQPTMVLAKKRRRRRCPVTSGASTPAGTRRASMPAGTMAPRTAAASGSERWRRATAERIA